MALVKFPAWLQVSADLAVNEDTATMASLHGVLPIHFRGDMVGELPVSVVGDGVNLTAKFDSIDTDGIVWYTVDHDIFATDADILNPSLAGAHWNRAGFYDAMDQIDQVFVVKATPRVEA